MADDLRDDRHALATILGRRWGVGNAVLATLDDIVKAGFHRTDDQLETRITAALAALNGAPIPLGADRTRYAAAILRGDT